MNDSGPLTQLRVLFQEAAVLQTYGSFGETIDTSLLRPLVLQIASYLISEN